MGALGANSSMAMAVSSAFTGAKFETLIRSRASADGSTPTAAAHIRVLCKPIRTRRASIRRGGPTVRCEVGSDVLVQINTASSSPSLSALEQLKTSAADSTLKFLHYTYAFVLIVIANLWRLLFFLLISFVMIWLIWVMAWLNSLLRNA